MSKKTILILTIVVAAILGASVFWLGWAPIPEIARKLVPGEIASRAKAPGSESVVRLRVVSFALSLHPLKMADVESRQVASLLHAGLIFQDDSGDVKPVLAESWTHSGNEWRFKLRPGVTFTDGSAVATSDVVTSICNAMQPTSPWAWALASITHEPSEDGKNVKCTGLEAVGDREIRLIEKAASAALLDALSGPAGWILPAKATEQPYGVIPGIGPYKVKEIVADNRIVLEARTGGAIQPQAGAVQFNFIADDSAAAARFVTGQLDVLDLTSPQLVELVIDAQSGKPKGGGTLQQRNWDRVRIVVVSENRLAEKGFKKPQVRQFINAFSSSIDRARIAELSKGTAMPMMTPFPPLPDISIAPSDTAGLPQTNLTIITEPDAYSDLIAASLPKTVGVVKIDYKGVDKAVLINSLVKGEFDLASILIEATVHSAEFWRSFFTPGNPFTAFGKPIEGMQAVEVQTDADLQRAGNLIAEQGNWVGVLRERRIQAVKPGVTGIQFSASGQTNYAYVAKQ